MLTCIDGTEHDTHVSRSQHRKRARQLHDQNSEAEGEEREDEEGGRVNSRRAKKTRHGHKKSQKGQDSSKDDTPKLLATDIPEEGRQPGRPPPHNADFVARLWRVDSGLE